MTENPPFINALLHFITIFVLMAHLLMYLPFKPRPLPAVFGCLVILLSWPAGLWLVGSKTALYSLPLVVPLAVFCCAAVYRVFVLAAGFRQIFFTIVTTMVHMHVTFFLIYAAMTQVLGFPVDGRTNLIARALYWAVTLLSLPLFRLYARPRLRLLLEAMDRQRLWLVIVLSCALLLIGHAMTSILLSRQDPVALRNCVAMAFCIVVFYYTLYSFIIRENANQRLQNQVEAAERLARTYAFYDAELREKEQAIRTLRHDFKHMILHLEGLLKDKDYEGVARHLAGLADRAAEMRPVAYCENMTVNTLTGYYFARAAELGITCAATLYVPEKLALPAAELAVILGNALDNALKGAATLGETGYLKFEARPVKDCLVFDLENNHRPGHYQKGAGVGLASLRELCEKNGGRAKVTDEGGVFRLNIVLRLTP